MVKVKTRYAIRSGSDDQNYGATYKGVDAQIIGEALEEIRQQNEGKLVATHIVDAAKPKDAPLHPVFTWDDKAAARAHRLWEARECIRNVIILRDTGADSSFVHVPIRTEGKGYWKPAEELAESAEEFEAALRQAKVKLIGAQNAFEQIRRQVDGQETTASIVGLIIDALGTARQLSEKIQ